MITVRDHERKAACQVTADEENRRKRLAFLNALQVVIDVRFVAGQKRQLRGAQQILRRMVNDLRATQALDQRVGFSFGTEKRQEFERGLEILTFLAFRPVEF